MDYEYHFFAVPEALIFAANQLAMVVAYSAADGETFGAVNAEDASKNLYNARNIWAQSGLFDALQAPLVRPAWDTEEIIDMDAAAQAQAALLIVTEPTPVTHDKITAIRGLEGQAALDALSVTLLPPPEATEQENG